MIPAVMPTQTIYRNDLWEQVYYFGPVEDELSDPPEIEGLSCRMQFRDVYDNFGYELSSIVTEGKGTITIIDSVNHEFDIPAQALPLEVGTWLWDFEVFGTDDLTGLGITYYSGKIIVVKDISHA